jgi:hypothetical protein
VQIFTNLHGIISQKKWTAISTSLESCKSHVVYLNEMITLYAVSMFESHGNNNATLLSPWSFLLQCRNRSVFPPFRTILCIKWICMYQLILLRIVSPSRWKLDEILWELLGIHLHDNGQGRTQGGGGVAGLQPPKPPKAKIKTIHFVDIMISKVLHVFPFSQN